ncbi:Uncharacterised protein [Mycobacterium tuberculosis]|nr:Uncharacterised protein [Mycobacterium tuberculosis]
MVFQENRFWPPPCNIRIVGRSAAAAPRFHSSATRVIPRAPENATAWGLLLTALTGPDVTLLGTRQIVIADLEDAVIKVP